MNLIDHKNFDFNYQLFFDLHLDFLCITDSLGNFLHTNKAFNENLSYTSEDLYMQSLFDFIHPSDLPDLYKSLSKIDRDNCILKFTNRIRHKNGSYRYIEWMAQNKGKYIYASARDVTSHQQRAIELKANNLYMQGILESQTNYIIRLNLDFQYTYVNSIFEREFGFLYKNKAMIGTNAFLNIPAFETLKEFCKNYKNKVNERQQIETALPLADGNAIFILWDCICLPNSQGEPFEIQCIGINITNRKNKINLVQEKNEAAFLELSAPISQLWKGILFLPVVGLINKKRAFHIRNTILDHIQKTGAKVLILDISALEHIDDIIINYIIILTKITRLMGCLCTLCGLNPNIAKSMMDSDLKLIDVYTTSSMKSALEQALKLTNYELVSIEKG